MAKKNGDTHGEIEKVAPSDYAIMSRVDEVSRIVKENLGGELNVLQLTRVKVPSGGSTVWEIPTLDGDTDAAKELKGIIVYHRPCRRYYDKPYEDSAGAGAPPTCYSDAGVRGRGNPGGLCAKCAMNQFGTAPRGAGKACGERRMLLISSFDELLPTMLIVPPTSMKIVNAFLARLSSKAIIYYGVEVAIGLVKTKNDTAEYSQLNIRVLRHLDKDSVDKIGKYRAGLIPVVEQIAVDIDPEKE